MAANKEQPENLKDAARRLEETLNGNGQVSGQQIAEDLENLKSALDHLRKDLKKVAGEAFQSSFETAKEKVAQGQKAAVEFGKDIDRRVHDNPWTSIGIVGIFAFLIGFLLGRKD